MIPRWPAALRWMSPTPSGSRATTFCPTCPRRPRPSVRRSTRRSDRWSSRKFRTTPAAARPATARTCYAPCSTPTRPTLPSASSTIPKQLPRRTPPDRARRSRRASAARPTRRCWARHRGQRLRQERYRRALHHAVAHGAWRLARHGQDGAAGRRQRGRDRRLGVRANHRRGAVPAARHRRDALQVGGAEIAEPFPGRLRRV